MNEIQILSELAQCPSLVCAGGRERGGKGHSGTLLSSTAGVSSWSCPGAEQIRVSDFFLLSRLHTQKGANVGLEFRTLRSKTELISKVRHSTD